MQKTPNTPTPTKVTKVFVLLSGGVDSSTVLAMARDEFPTAEIEAVTINYGQRHIKERECAQWQAGVHNAAFTTLDLTGLMSGMLVDKGDQNEQIPDASYADLPHGISPTYVSFRNGLMLSALAARAQSWIMASEKTDVKDKAHHRAYCDIHYDDETLKPWEDKTYEAVLYVGVHADDGANDAYPDCTLEFVGAMASAIYIGTYHKVRLRAPLVHMDKAEVVRQGERRGVLYAHTWSCYAGGDLHCGTCPTCRARKQAFIDAGFEDPTQYATDLPEQHPIQDAPNAHNAL